MNVKLKLLIFTLEVLADANIKPFLFLTMTFLTVFWRNIKTIVKPSKIGGWDKIFYSKKFQINPILSEKSR